jgi:NTP pyrophosphatase (non-canonical NTP hydrolase)
MGDGMECGSCGKYNCVCDDIEYQAERRRKTREQKLKHLESERLRLVNKVIDLEKTLELREGVIRILEDEVNERLPNPDAAIVVGIQDLCSRAHDMSKSKGFWEKERNSGECIALIHSELSELLEAFRDGNPDSVKIPEFSSAEEEIADVFIRLADFCGALGFGNTMAQAILAKMEYNATRPRKHGRGF